MIHIVGGGIHGCFFAIALQAELGLSHSQIRIYDPHPALLYNWLQRTQSCAMLYLRSNSSHSIHVDFNALRDFARDSGIDPWNSDHFALPYHRPSLDLFNKHAQACLEKYHLVDIHIPLKVDALLPEGGVRVKGEDLPGTVIYAAGDDALFLPRWAREKHVHVFSGEFHKMHRNIDAISHRPAIVGGGITALQLAISLAKQGKHPCLVTRRPLKVFRFDFAPCYVGQPCLLSLDKLEQSDSGREGSGREQRMNKILANRFTGTIPQEIFDDFQKLLAVEEASHKIIPHEAELAGLSGAAGTAIFCTGFEQKMTPPPLLQKAGQKFIHGYPVLGRDLKWGKGVFVSGKNAMYRIGPASPNIIGAHLAWRIIKTQINR